MSLKVINQNTSNYSAVDMALKTQKTLILNLKHWFCSYLKLDVCILDATDCSFNMRIVQL